MAAWIVAAVAIAAALFLFLSRPMTAGGFGANGQSLPPPSASAPDTPSTDPVARTVGALVDGAFAFFAKMGDRPSAN